MFGERVVIADWKHNQGYLGLGFLTANKMSGHKLQVLSFMRSLLVDLEKTNSLLKQALLTWKAKFKSNLIQLHNTGKSFNATQLSLERKR